MNRRIHENVIFQSCSNRAFLKRHPDARVHGSCPQHTTGRFPFIFEVIEYICNGRSFRVPLVRRSTISPNYNMVHKATGASRSRPLSYNLVRPPR